MAESRRGAILTGLGALFFLAAIEDILKPFHLEGPTTGLVFLGRRLNGVPNAILGPLLGVFLVIYAAGICRIRSYALSQAYGYAVYVVINLVLFTARYPAPTAPGEKIFGLVYTALALVITWGAAIALTRRKADLT
jgi:hypothetical protein